MSMDVGESQTLPTIPTSVKEKGFGSWEMQMDGKNGSIAINCYDKTYFSKEISGDVDGWI